MKKTCTECGLKLKGCLPTTRLVGGTILYVCPDCWTKFDYDTYMKGN